MKEQFSNSRFESIDTTDDERISNNCIPNLMNENSEQTKKNCINQKIYSKFRYQGSIYSVGDTVMLSDGENGFYVAKIVKVIVKNGIISSKQWPSIQVQWYYRKNDIVLSNSNATYKVGLSDNEVFISDHYENVIIESIISKCTVKSADDYEKGVIDDKTFFSRSTYNYKKVRINQDYF